MNMRRKSLLLASAGGLAISASAKADLLYYDSFGYAVQAPGSGQLGHNFPTTAGAGIPNWLDYYNADKSAYVSSGNLSYPGLTNSFPNSNSTTFYGIGSLTTVNGSSLKSGGIAYHFFDQPATWDGTTQPPYTSYSDPASGSYTLYYSMLLKVNQINPDSGGNGWGGTSGFGFAGFGASADYHTGASPATMQGTLSIRPGGADNTYQIGLETPDRAFTFDTTDRSVGADSNTLFIVVASTFLPGSNTNYSQLWINPATGSSQADNTNFLTTPTPATESAPIVNFTLHDSGQLPDEGLQIDELRVGTTWSDVAAWATPGDANCDGTVDSSDFDILAANFGNTNGVNWNLGDFNDDGTVNALDFNALATNWGFDTTGAGPLAGIGAVAPEPSSALLLLLSASGLLVGRRRGARVR